MRVCIWPCDGAGVCVGFLIVIMDLSAHSPLGYSISALFACVIIRTVMNMCMYSYIVLFCLSMYTQAQRVNGQVSE